ncbi:hypothetical protein ACIHCQ_10010 [Streptomyces sp. NPDC052236]|uniref:hypothetical protein n=1 Tax=Streptomyces sp. NPDC052236 TaxID=3365686 RepID=UPI0037CED2B8
MVGTPQAARCATRARGHEGTVGDTERDSLNLYEPGAVRRLLDEATERGLLPTVAGT